MADPIKLNTKISVSMHPMTIERFAPAMTGGRKSIYEVAHRAMTEVYTSQDAILASRSAEYAKIATPQALKQLALAREGKARAPDGTVYGKDGLQLGLPAKTAAAFNENATNRFMYSARLMDEARKTITNEITSLVTARALKTTSPAAKTPAGVAEAAELRSYLRTLPQNDRAALVRKQIAAGDLKMAEAVSSAQSFLSGIDDTTQEALRNEAYQVFAPEEASQIDALTGLVKALEDCGTMAVNGYSEALVRIPENDTEADKAAAALASKGKQS
jgi:hypothetical protein